MMGMEAMGYEIVVVVLCGLSSKWSPSFNSNLSFSGASTIVDSSCFEDPLNSADGQHPC